MNDQSAPPPAAFREPGDSPGPLPARVAARLAAGVGDVALVMDGDGTILDLAVSSQGLAANGFGGWTGVRWADTVNIESKAKIAEMLRDAAADETPRWRQVNHPTSAGDIAVRYLTVGAGAGGRVIAIGRDMRAQAAMQQRLLQTQQSLERDYLNLRQAESRYRLLFDVAAEPVLVIDAATRRIREANPAAHRLLGMKDGALVNQAAGGIVAPADRDAMLAFLGAAASAEVAPVTLGRSGDEEPMRVSATLFRQDRAALLLVRLTLLSEAANDRGVEATAREVIERMPDAFVLADAALNILTANAAFLDFAQAASADRVHGQPLANWLGRPGIDLDLFVTQLREHGAIRNVATILRGSGGAQDEVEVSGVAAPGDSGDVYGFTIRGVGRRLRDAPPVDLDLPRSVEQLTGLVGRMPLKDIVRESTDLIERLCIEAALAYTSDNRASAAEILGVSRQSLYSKLHRHGLGNLMPGGGE